MFKIVNGNHGMNRNVKPHRENHVRLLVLPRSSKGGTVDRVFEFRQFEAAAQVDLIEE